MINWRSYSSLFQKTYRRSTFITSTSKNAGCWLMRRFVGPRPSYRPTPPWLSAADVPSLPSGGKRARACVPHATRYGPHSTQETWIKPGILRRKTKKNLCWKKQHLWNGGAFHPTLRMSHCYEEKKSKMQVWRGRRASPPFCDCIT